MKKYKYIYFEKIEDKKKTAVYSCRNIKCNLELGTVKWYPAWRQYCYFQTCSAVYSVGCLADINDFITGLKNASKTN